MNQALVTLALGFFLGVRHATDPDHIVAITTIVTRYRRFRDAAVIGACWGLGHTATILVVGGGILLSSWVIPARLGLSMEFAVGLMLIALGLAALIRTARQIRASAVPETVRPSVTHSHVHGHGDYIHTHPHGHEPEAHPHDPDRNPVRWLDRRFGGLKLYQLGRPLAIGVVHGLAGSAAIPLLVLAAIGDRRSC